ncbi:MAG: hypothetical protein OSB25_10530 [Salibacteraceae bacterium]|nr:hypothetical protein [Salibacteraceae bacterium]
MNIKEGTVKSKLFYAKQVLSEKLEIFHPKNRFIEKNLDRYFELERKVLTDTIGNIEIEEWKTLNLGIMNENKIDNTLRNGEINSTRLHVKVKLDAAFEKKFGSDNQFINIQQNNVIPFPNKVRQLWAPPVNWAALASIAAVFIVLFMLRTVLSFQENSVFLADSSLQYGADNTSLIADSLLY